MKPQIYRDYVNLSCLQKTILLGDIFGVEIRNIDARMRQANPYRICFTKGKERCGFIDQRIRHDFPEKYFELKSSIGKIKGYFCHTLDPDICFSLAVKNKPYDTITGFYNASFSRLEDFKISQSIRCSLEKENQLMQTIDFYSFLELSQCYKDSPTPYERLFISASSGSDFSLLHEKDYDFQNQTLCTKSQIVQEDSTIRMIEPTSFAVECSKEKENTYYSDYANIDYDKIYGLLAQHDDSIGSCLDHFHELLTFDNLDLYQNMVSACFPSINQHTASLLTGVEKAPYQKNLKLVSRLNAQKQ